MGKALSRKCKCADIINNRRKRIMMQDCYNQEDITKLALLESLLREINSRKIRRCIKN
jgi:hypothetical protein